MFGFRFFHINSISYKHNSEPRIFLRNSLEEDLMALYERLVVLGMEYSKGSVYLADLEKARQNIHALKPPLN